MLRTRKFGKYSCSNKILVENKMAIKVENHRFKKKISSNEYNLIAYVAPGIPR